MGPGEAEPTFDRMGKKCSCILVCSEASTFDGYQLPLFGYPSIRSPTGLQRFFFLEYAKDLRIFVLRSRNSECYNDVP